MMTLCDGISGQKHNIAPLRFLLIIYSIEGNGLYFLSHVSVYSTPAKCGNGGLFVL